MIIVTEKIQIYESLNIKANGFLGVKYISPLPDNNSTAMRSNDTSTRTVAPIPQASLPRKFVPNQSVTKPTNAFSKRVPKVPKIFFIIELNFMQKYDFIGNFSIFFDNKKNMSKTFAIEGKIIIFAHHFGS